MIWIAEEQRTVYAMDTVYVLIVLSWIAIIAYGVWLIKDPVRFEQFARWCNHRNEKPPQ